jgi:hypothetical protein
MIFQLVKSMPTYIAPCHMSAAADCSAGDVGKRMREGKREPREVERHAAANIQGHKRTNGLKKRQREDDAYGSEGDVEERIIVSDGLVVRCGFRARGRALLRLGLHQRLRLARGGLLCRLRLGAGINTQIDGQMYGWRERDGEVS